MKNTDPNAVPEALALVEQALALLTQARTRLQMDAGVSLDAPYMDAKLASRVEKLGEVAYRHAAFIETNGSMTRADSLAIRREMYGANVQGTANLFGTKGSGALFYRNRPKGSPIKDRDPILLTAEGTKIAELWKAAHPD